MDIPRRFLAKLDAEQRPTIIEPVFAQAIPKYACHRHA
jgi:hypothetical protein